MKKECNWTYTSNILPHLFYTPSDRIKDFIHDRKRQMLCAMFDEHPASVYEAICFKLKFDKGKIYEEIENWFKKADGRYIYNGEFVSREFLCKRFGNLPCRITMTVYAKEEDLESE